jgi:hypothetical protein
MNAAALFVAGSCSSFISAQDTVYTVTDIRIQSNYAGRLGRRTSETLVISLGEQKYTIKVDGDYHSLCHRPTHAVRVGDKVKIGGKSNPKDGRVRREDIQRVK